MKKFISFLALAAFFVATAFSQELNNNIIRFASHEARASYIDELLLHDSNVEVSYIDSVFIGLITRHSSDVSAQSELSALGRMHASGNRGILDFEKDQVFTISGKQNSPPWHLDRIDQRALPLDSSFSYDDSTSEVNIYIADTGVQISHNEFGGRASGAYSAVSGLKPGSDCHGHGTHVAALAAGATFGTAKNAKVHDVRVLNCNGSGSTSGIVSGMDWISKNAKKPAVVNMSLGGSYSSSLNNAVTSLNNAGVTVIVAAGNENTDACQKSPASSPDAFTVGATDSSDARSSFSNYGSCVNIYSPGSDILSAGISSNSATKTMSGTSMASPIVVGVAASLLQRNPTFSPQQLKSKVLEYATTTSNSNINPFVYNQVDSEPEPEPEPEPEDPSNESVIAYISGSPIKKVDGSQSVVLDASFSHASIALQKKLCGSDDAMKFSWKCIGSISNSEVESSCNGEEISSDSKLILSKEQLEKLKGTGPSIFSVTVSLGEHTASASSVLIVGNSM